MTKCVISREVVEEGAVNDALRSGAINWRPGAVSEFESLWSIVHKFAYLNRIGAVEVRQILGPVEWAKKPKYGVYYWNDDRADLHYCGYLDRDRLRTRLGLSQHQIEQATIAAYTLPASRPDDQSLISTSRDLRYCPSCMQRGFHSPLHQVRWIVCCPIHDIPLMDRCPGCDEFIPYRLTPKAIVNPFGCKCGQVLWSARDTAHWPRPLDEREEGVLAAYVRWRAEVRQQLPLTFREFGFSANPWHDSWQGLIRNIDLSGTAGRWHGIHPVQGWPAHVFLQRSQEEHSYVEVGERFSRIRCRLPEREVTESSIARNDQAALMSDFRVVYKCIRRRLLRRILHEHRRCITMLYPLALLEGFRLTPPYCPWGYAFMVWWGQWGGQKERTAEILHQTLSFSAWDAALMAQIGDCVREAMIIVQPGESGNRADQERITMVRWLCRRVLGLSMLASFDDTVDYALEKLGMAKQGSDRHNGLHPYFLFQSDPFTGKHSIHWWMVPVLDRLEHQVRTITGHPKGMERHINSLIAKYYGWRKPRVRRYRETGR